MGFTRRLLIKEYFRPTDYLYRYDVAAEASEKASLVANLAIERVLYHDNANVWVISSGDEEHKGRKLCRITPTGKVEEILAIDDHWVTPDVQFELSPTGKFLALVAMHDEHDFHRERELAIIDLMEKRMVYLGERITPEMPEYGLESPRDLRWFGDSFLLYDYSVLIDLGSRAITRKPFTMRTREELEGWGLDGPHVRKPIGLFDHQRGLLFFHGEEKPVVDVLGEGKEKVSSLEIDPRGEWAAFVPKGVGSYLYLVDGRGKEKSLLFSGSCFGLVWLPGVE